MTEESSLFKTLSEAEDCKSLLKKHLTREKYEALAEKKTPLEGTLDDCIRSGEFCIHKFYYFGKSDIGHS